MESVDRNFDVRRERYSELQEEIFSRVEEALIEFGAGSSKTGARDQATNLTNNISHTEFKETGLSDKQFGRKLYAKMLTAFSYVLGNFLKEFVECNYPAGRFIEVQQRMRADSQLRIKKLQDSMPEDRGPPKDKEYYNTLGLRAWNQLVKETKAETIRREDATFTPVSGKGKKGKSEQKSEAEPVEDLPALPDIGADAKESFLEMYVDKYMQEQEDFSERKRLLAMVEQLKKQAEEEKDSFIVINIIVDGVRSAIATIVQKIKASLSPNYVNVQNKLTATVILDSTGEFITNPLESSNLAGICHILKQEYHTANLVRFNRDFSELLRCPATAEELKKDPTRASRLTDKKIAEWLSINSWSFMTFDIFFTNILLCYLPQTVFKSKCIEKVSEYLQKVESGEIKDSVSVSQKGGLGAMPIYTHLVEYMRLQQESENYVSIANNKTGGNDSSAPGAGNAQRNRYHNSGLENAASADVSTQYTTEVTREKNVTTNNVITGRKVGYCATKTVCPVCYGKSTGDKVEPHKPRCYDFLCYLCGMYGHKKDNCMQHPSSYAQKK